MPAKILQSEIPTVDELLQLDSFDLAFLTMTGYVRFVPLEKFVANVCKANKDTVLWGPQARLLQRILTTAFNKHAKPLMNALTDAFDLSEDISLKKNPDRLFKKHKNVGKKAWKEVEEKIKSALELTGKKARQNFEKKISRATAKKQDVRDLYLAEALADHIQTFMETYPNRILHPEIERLVEIVETNPAMRTIDKVALRDRLKDISKMPERYFTNVADVHAGRMWNFSGLQMMQATGITTYQVVATWDRRTCPVCKNIDGKIFDVPQAYAKMTEYLDIDPGNPEAIAEAMPFVRFSDVDNKSPKEVRAMGLTPPFHPRCRCDVVVLGTRTVGGAERPRPIGPFKFVPAKSIKEAEKWARKSLVVGNVDYTGLDVAVANEINETIGKLIAEKKLKYIGDIRTIDASKTTAKNLSSQAIAQVEGNNLWITRQKMATKKI